MRAIAILGPNASERDVGEFRRNSQWEVTVADSPCCGADATLVFGGDGTVHRHLRAAVESNAPVLAVPTGSGNDFHHALGIQSPQHALDAWAAFQDGGENVRAIDLGVIRSLHESGDATRTAEFFCAMALLPSLIRYRAQTVTLTTDSRAISKQVMLAAFANTPSYGGGMKVAPLASMQDGLLDICVVRRMSKLRLLALFPVVYWGRHMGMKEVEYLQAPCLRVESERPMDVYGDGDFVCKTPVEIGIAPRALKVITGM